MRLCQVSLLKANKLKVHCTTVIAFHHHQRATGLKAPTQADRQSTA